MQIKPSIDNRTPLFYQQKRNNRQGEHSQILQTVPLTSDEPNTHKEINKTTMKMNKAMKLR